LTFPKLAHKLLLDKYEIPKFLRKGGEKKGREKAILNVKGFLGKG